MACKLKCPLCELVLREEGDEGKASQSEYRVYDSNWNSKHKAHKFRLVECLNCHYCGTVKEFDVDREY